jgi:signal transduction histidine kinase/CheY-like chemotaxis protein
MKALGKYSISVQLTLATMAASGVALLLASGSYLAFDRRSFEESLRLRLDGQAQIVALNSATAVVFRDPESARATLAALRSDSDVVSAAIFTPDGRLFAQYVRPGAVPDDQQLSEGLADGMHRLQGDQLVLVRPVELEGARVGRLMIRMELLELRRRLWLQAAIVALVSLVAFLVALLVGHRAQGTIARPLLALAAASRRISHQNDFTARVPGEGRAEIGELVRAFNHMLDTLQHRDEELTRTHRELERRIAESTALFRKAEEANRAKDEFLATLSHELRTPLNAILGWAHLLRSGLDPTTADRALETISRNAVQQGQLIADILDMQRIVAGKLRLSLRTVDVAEVVLAAVETVRPAARAKAIEIATALEPGAEEVLADPDRLQQVFWNLLSNAVKFAPREGCVRIALAADSGQVVVSVEDNGAGMHPEFIPYAFERFRQADSSSTRRHGGLGLGLAIARHLTELHGGTVEAANRQDGNGAIFTVRLPRLLPAFPAAVPGVVIGGRHARPEDDLPLSGAPDLHGISVLVVDDEADARELAAAILTRCGATVTTVASALEGLDRLRRERPDVLLSDLEMPDQDGYALIVKVRALAPEQGGQTPAAALTAYAGAETRLRALAAGFDIHVPKPAQPAELAAVVASLARRSGIPERA